MNDIDTLLRAADPGADTPAYNQTDRRLLLQRAMRHQPKTRSSLAWRIGAVAAAALTVIGLGVANLGGGATARAEEVLKEAAINAVDPPAEASQYWKVSAHHEYGDGNGCVTASIETTYLAVGGARPSWFLTRGVDSPGCQFTDEEQTWTMQKSPNDLADNWRWPSPAFLASLPRDVDELRARMLADSEGVAGSPEAGVFVLTADTLTYGTAPADLRAAMFGVLGTLPGLSLADEMVIDGTEVAVIKLATEEITELLLLDTATGNLVGFQGVQSERKVTYEREVVDAVPAEIKAAADVRDCEVVFAEDTDPLGALSCG